MLKQLPTKEIIDMKGKKITPFILDDVVMKLKDMEEGEVLEIIADDFEPIESDVRAWSRMTGNNLVEVEKEANFHRYYVEKGTPKGFRNKLALVVSDPGLEQLISPLGFAWGAALSGTEVYIYFQGPAVRVLKKGFKEHLKGINRPFSGFARKGLADMGHIPPQEKLGRLKELGAHFYVCGASMDHYGVEKADLAFDDVIIAEYITFMEVMEKADINFFLQ